MTYFDDMVYYNYSQYILLDYLAYCFDNMVYFDNFLFHGFFDNIVYYITSAGLIAFILNMTMIFVGYYVAKFLTSGIAQRKCISLECGLQNGTLAVFVTTQLFDDIVFMVPTAAYALVMFCTSIIFVLIVRKIN